MILLRIISLPVALVYGLIIYLRNYLYDVGLFKSKTFKTPTICVGNLSLGGTGKTPMVEFLISALQSEYKLAILSRGYRRKSEGYVLADMNSTVEQLGDEPYQIHKKFENIILAVDTNRGNGIQMLVNDQQPELIILDDAYQHRKVKSTFAILLTAFDKCYPDDFFVPYGTLRDSRNQAKRADVIIVTKCPSNLSEDERMGIIKRLKPSNHQRVLFSYLTYHKQLKGLNTSETLDSLKTKKFTLVTGIANPIPFIDFLKQLNLQFEHLRFKDHHSFSQSEIETINSKEFIVTTEKDFVRLQGKVKNLAYIEIAHEFIDDGKTELLSELKKIMKPHS